jgi:peptidoglycan/LPS O-acetylase OafA/YrhL
VTGLAIAIGLAMLLLQHSPEGPFARDNLPRGLFGFFLGQLLWHQRMRLAEVPAVALWGIMALGIALPPDWLGAIVPYALLVFPAALVLGLRCAWLESRPLVWLGDRSYALSHLALHFVEYPAREAIRVAWRRRRKAAPTLA